MDEPSKPLIIVTIPNSITLTSTNYHSWKTQVKAVLIAFDLFDKHIESPLPSTTTTPTPAYQIWFRQDKLIFGVLIGTISNNLVPIVSQAKTTRELWDKLAKTFDKTLINVSECSHQIIDLTSPPSSPSNNEPNPAVRNQKRRRKNNVKEGERMDRLSNLPHDIMVHILSFVDIKSAARSSLVSKKWRYVWTHLVNLVFEAPESYDLSPRQLIRGIDDTQVEIFCTMVNKVMTANCATFLNSFRIRFPLKKRTWNGIDNRLNFLYHPRNNNFGDLNKWVQLALTKKVRNFELNLSDFQGNNVANSYTIGKDFFLVRPVYNDHLNTLQSLHLEGLNMDGPVLENALAYCLNLECLTARSLRNYPTLFMASFDYTQNQQQHQHLVVSSLKLKYLEICHCYDIKSLKISAPKLTSFTYFANYGGTEVEYTNVPSLVNVTFGDNYCFHILHNLHLISSFSHRLEKLAIHWNQENRDSYGLYEILRDNLLDLRSFIEKCPRLHTFKLELWPLSKQPVPMSGQRDVTINYKMCKHNQLKVLEIVGFDGSASLAEFVFCVTQNAPMLKKIICDYRCPRSKGNAHKWYDLKYIDRKGSVRRQAKLLAKQIRGGVDVVIL